MCVCALYTFSVVVVMAYLRYSQWRPQEIYYSYTDMLYRRGKIFLAKHTFKCLPEDFIYCCDSTHRILQNFGSSMLDGFVCMDYICSVFKYMFLRCCWCVFEDQTLVSGLTIIECVSVFCVYNLCMEIFFIYFIHFRIFINFLALLFSELLSNAVL